MTLRQKIATTFLTLAITAGVVTDARAQAFLTPFAGVTFGGDSAKNKLSTGVGLTFMGPVVGAELELGYTPDFFGEQQGTVLIGDSNVTTLMGSLMIGLGAGPVRPYITGGVGLMRSRLDDAGDLFDNVSSNDWGVSAGGGLIAMFSPHVGFRADARYFRRVGDSESGSGVELSLGNFNYWRATGGLTFKF